MAGRLQQMLKVSCSRRRVALMQPYFLPYLGYFQLIAAADLFVIYDNVQFIKNGWIERNRYLLGQEPKWFGVPLSKCSHSLHIRDKRIAAHFNPDEILNKLAFAYRQAPYANRVLPWLESLLVESTDSIAELNEQVMRACCDLLELDTPIINASQLPMSPNLKGQGRVLDVVQAVAGTHYLNPLAGEHLYDAIAFKECGITLELLQASLPPYAQGSDDKPFIPGLSILDALMFNPAHTVGEWARQGVIVHA